MAIREIHRSALVTFTPEQMFDLVIDVERYPEFLPWVATAKLHERSNNELLASIVVRMVWKQHHRRLRKLWEKVKAGRPRHWRAKSPHDCPACQAGVKLAVQRGGREVAPWAEVKSRRGRKKRIETKGYACPNQACKYCGNTDPEVHALVGYGKRGKCHNIQTLKCQACGCVFSSRRNTPLYYVKTAWDRVEIVLWLLAEGVDVSVLVRYTGHVDATLTRWLMPVEEVASDHWPAWEVCHAESWWAWAIEPFHNRFTLSI